MLYCIPPGIPAEDGGPPCAFDQIHDQAALQAAQLRIQDAIQARKAQKDALLDEHESYTIPVVVHILHEGGDENISDDQVHSQIRILNEDFGRLPGTPGAGEGVDSKLRFCLARLDPQGRCTDGIVRIRTALSDHQTFQRPQLGALSFWEPTRYLNIYVVGRIAGGVSGYASFPDGPPEEDGIVVEHNHFGNVGSAEGRMGRTTTHEVGHWLGLFHTFHNGCGDDPCTDGDFVCDTPPASAPHSGCPWLVNSCHNDEPDTRDQVENYMDYTSDVCRNVFTAGQAERMHATIKEIRSVIWSDANLQASGCDEDYTPPDDCVVAADFVALHREICIGNSIEFMDRSLNKATRRLWTFEGGDPASSEESNPEVSYAAAGKYSVTLRVWNAEGGDSISRSDYITVQPPGTGAALPFNAHFEADEFPPAGIEINNLDGGISWERDSLAAVSGRYSLRINNLVNTNFGSVDEVLLPFLDLSSIPADCTLSLGFHWAYARSDPNFSDELLVLLSTDCGNTFTRLFYGAGNSLATGPTQETPYIPKDEEWRSARIDLQEHRSARYARIKFVNVTDGGNNLYLDDIAIGTSADLTVDVRNESRGHFNVAIAPNPSGGDAALSIFAPAAGQATISVFHILGRKESRHNVVLQVGRNSIPLRLTHVPAGTYVVEIQVESQTMTRRLVKLP